jgi:hypothetical protein
MSDRKKQAERRQQQALEVDESQARLRSNIAEAKRLLDEADQMLRRHRAECEEDEAAADDS